MHLHIAHYTVIMLNYHYLNAQLVVNVKCLMLKYFLSITVLQLLRHTYKSPLSSSPWYRVIATIH